MLLFDGLFISLLLLISVFIIGVINNNKVFSEGIILSAKSGPANIPEGVLNLVEI